jgi:putative Holliday junction resolvase
VKRLGVDPGSVRIGVAVSDEDGMLASPLATVDARKPDAAREVADHARREDAKEIVIGLPLTLAGKEGDAARRARALAKAIAKHTDVPLVMWDERLTTAEATRALAASEVRGKKRRAMVDRVAATVLLQSYLDARARKRWDEETSDGPGGHGSRAR